MLTCGSSLPLLSTGMSSSLNGRGLPLFVIGGTFAALFEPLLRGIVAAFMGILEGGNSTTTKKIVYC